MFLRAAYGNTVARPIGRELAPVNATDYIRHRDVSGNPDLTRTLIHNFDLRWELFPTPTEVFAISAFYKSFRHPIEATIADTNNNITFKNVDGAINYGVELEARAGLGLLNASLSSFSVVGNLALIRSRVELSPAQKANATNAERALAGQSPYVANVGLTFEPPDLGLTTSVYYNVFGPRIEEVGIQQLPDTFEQPFHSLDFMGSYELGSFTLGFSATNLLYQQVRVTQGEVTTTRSQKGVSCGVNVAWKY
jgi:TonB dependent receptor